MQLVGGGALVKVLRQRVPPLRYFTATPEGKFSVVNGDCGVNPPEAGVMAYCETVAELMRNAEIELDPVFTTYRKLAYASTFMGPGRSPTE